MVQKKDKVPSPSSKTAQDILPRSSQSENLVFHFPQKKKIFRFWCEWDLIPTRYSKEKMQKKMVNKKTKKVVKKILKMSDKKVPCPPHTPLLSTSHHRSLRPHYRFGS